MEMEDFEWKDEKYEWPVVAPKTGKVERINPVPFHFTSQKRNPSYTDNFDAEVLDLAWNFRRVPLKQTYSLTKNKGHLRLFTKPNVIKERKRANLMGFRQTESDFEYMAKMNFKPKSNLSEAGISIFQKDNNYITFTAIKGKEGFSLQLRLAIPNRDPKIIKKEFNSRYTDNITFKIKSENHNHLYYYSIDGSEFILFSRTEANLLLSKGYTGAYLGVYASSNGEKSKDYADFDWVSYIGFEKN
jgi:alpha-N-arabinofuranosidase